MGVSTIPFVPFPHLLTMTYTLPAELVIGILNYLRSRPYAEVAQGVEALEQALAEQTKPDIAPE